MTTEHIKIDRDTMIDHLAGSMVDAMEQDSDYCDIICRAGFKGYDNMTDTELIAEYREYISQDTTYPIIIELNEE